MFFLHFLAVALVVSVGGFAFATVVTVAVAGRVVAAAVAIVVDVYCERQAPSRVGSRERSK